jgi:hypothetical protein
MAFKKGFYKANGVDFSAKWGWVPLLDFAAALMTITEELESGQKGVSQI